MIAEKFGNLGITDPSDALTRRAIATLPMLPVKSSFITFNTRGIAEPKITDDYSSYLCQCRDHGVIPIQFHFEYEARTRSFARSDVVNVSAVMPGSCIYDNENTFRTNFIEQVALGGKVHLLSFRVNAGNMENGFPALRSTMLGLTEKEYSPYQFELGFARNPGQYDTRLILNYRSPSEGLWLELSKGRLLHTTLENGLADWFRGLERN